MRRHVMMLLILFLFVSSTPVFASKKHDSRGSLLFLPRDVAFDNTARKALQRLRRNKLDVNASSTLSSCGNFHHATMTMVGYKGGRIRDQVNQDRSFCIAPYHVEGYATNTNASQQLLLGVFDGHGNLGEEVAQYALDELPKRLGIRLSHIFSKDKKDSLDGDIQQALVQTFLEIDRSIPTKNGQGGCTASVVLQLGSKVYIANAGDSTSLIAMYNPANNTTRVVYTNRHDKPNLPEEYHRIVNMGGTVHIPKDDDARGDDSPRVLYTDPNTGFQMGLAMSRSIGDWDMVGVIAEPIVDVVDLNTINFPSKIDHETCSTTANENCQATSVLASNDISVFAISATDGMMDYLLPQELSTMIARAFCDADGPHPLTAIEDAILQAAKAWNHDMGGEYRDDIVIVASKLNVDSVASVENE